MLSRNLRRLGYALVLVYGIMDAVAPRTTLRLKLAPATVAFENVGEIEPRPWYLRAARAAGMGMIVAGAIGLALESAGGESGRDDAGDEAA
jgi:hypothetical protein